MTACSQWQPCLSDAAHGDLADNKLKGEFEAHLVGCDGCQQELQAQRAFLATMVLPAQPAAGELNAWREVGPQVYPAPPKRFVLGFPLAATLAFAMLVTGIGIGRLLVTQPSLIALDSAPPQLVGTAPVDAYVRFLESAAPLLLAVTNRQSETLVSARYPGQTHDRNEPQAAAVLAADANLLATQLEKQKRGREAALVRELELVFLQLANLSQSPDNAGLRLLQAAITDRALLFQLSVEELRRLPDSPPAGA